MTYNPICSLMQKVAITSDR